MENLLKDRHFIWLMFQRTKEEKEMLNTQVETLKTEIIQVKGTVQDLYKYISAMSSDCV